MFGNLASTLRKQNHLLRKTWKNFQKKIFLSKNLKKKNEKIKKKKKCKAKKKKALKFLRKSF